MQVRLTLEQAACVWTGTEFVAVTDAALQASVELSPYLHTVPPRLAAQHRDLLLALGVRATLRWTLSDLYRQQGCLQVSVQPIAGLSGVGCLTMVASPCQA